MTADVTVLAVRGLPEFREGDDLARAIADAVSLEDGDVVVVAQKVVSKVEGAVVDPPPDSGEDPRRAAARAEAAAIVADTPGVLIVRTRHGFVCANAGVDASNVPDGRLTLLPVDPDRSARSIRAGLRRLAGVDVAVVVSDTFGRPWRSGQVDVAIGTAGMAVVRDERGGVDRQGMALTVTEAAVVDELASAADLVRSKGDGVPVVVIRGFEWQPSETAAAADLVRDPAVDLFPHGRGMLAAVLTDGSWPARWSGGVSDEDLAAVRLVAPDVTVITAGPPAALRTADGLAAGLAAAVLADRGLRVRWRPEGQAVILEAGRPDEPL